MSTVASDMTQQEHTHDELAALAEREARGMLGVSFEDALSMLERGELAGTGAEAQLHMLRFLLNG